MEVAAQEPEGARLLELEGGVGSLLLVVLVLVMEVEVLVLMREGIVRLLRRRLEGDRRRRRLGWRGGGWRRR